jgi:hypothetical protein
MASAKKMDAFLGKDISQMSYEELEKAARHYGLDENSKVDLVQIDGLVPHTSHPPPHPSTLQIISSSGRRIVVLHCDPTRRDQRKDRCRRKSMNENERKMNENNVDIFFLSLSLCPSNVTGGAQDHQALP